MFCLHNNIPAHLHSDDYFLCSLCIQMVLLLLLVLLIAFYYTDGFLLGPLFFLTLVTYGRNANHVRTQLDKKSERWNSACCTKAIVGCLSIEIQYFSIQGMEISETPLTTRRTKQNLKLCKLIPSLSCSILAHYILSLNLATRITLSWLHFPILVCFFVVFLDEKNPNIQTF